MHVDEADVRRGYKKQYIRAKLEGVRQTSAGRFEQLQEDEQDDFRKSLKWGDVGEAFPFYG